jgi:hypothetical protein
MTDGRLKGAIRVIAYCQAWLSCGRDRRRRAATCAVMYYVDVGVGHKTLRQAGRHTELHGPAVGWEISPLRTCGNDAKARSQAISRAG